MALCIYCCNVGPCFLSNPSEVMIMMYILRPIGSNTCIVIHYTSTYRSHGPTIIPRAERIYRYCLTGILLRMRTIVSSNVHYIQHIQ